MKKKVIFENGQITVTVRVHPILGQIIQLIDESMIDRTPEGNGVMLDWDERYGVNINHTGISNKLPVSQILAQYIGQEETEIANF